MRPSSDTLSSLIECSTRIRQCGVRRASRFPIPRPTFCVAMVSVTSNEGQQDAIRLVQRQPRVDASKKIPHGLPRGPVPLPVKRAIIAADAAKLPLQVAHEFHAVEPDHGLGSGLPDSHIGGALGTA